MSQWNAQGVDVEVETRVEQEIGERKSARRDSEFGARTSWVGQEGVLSGTDQLLIPESAPAEQAPSGAWRQRLVFGTLQLLWRQRIFTGSIILLSACAGFVTARLRTPYYIAQATIFPPPMEGSIGGVGLASVAGLIGNLGLGTGASSLFPLYQTFTYSRTVVSELLELPLEKAGFNGTLLDRLVADTADRNQGMETGIEMVRRRLTFNSDKQTGVVTISYLDTDPKVAALVANHVIEALDRFDVQTATRRTGERRRFFEQRLNDSARALAEAESRIEQFRQENLRIGNAPSLLLEQARLERELEIEQQIYLTLRREYELARIDEERSVPVVNILDRAEPPMLPAGPSALKFTLAAGFLATCLSIGALAVVALRPRQAIEELLQAARLR